MPHFTLIVDEAGAIERILKDGQPVTETITLEPAYTVSSTYYQMARRNLDDLSKAADSELKRHLGLQSFLTSLTAVEAFTNVYFHLYGLQQKKPAVVARTNKRSGPLLEKIVDLVALAFGTPLLDQDRILEQLGQRYALRNTIVHPRWTPSSAWLGGSVPLAFDGMVENFMNEFRDPAFCRETLDWCLIYAVRVLRAAGCTDPGRVAFYWTGEYKLSEQHLMDSLEL